MPRGDGTGPQGMGRGTGRGAGRGRDRDFGMNGPSQRTTLAGTLFAFASVLIGKWLDKKFSQKQSKAQPKEDEKDTKNL
jgi:hypothetical protein